MYKGKKSIHKKTGQRVNNCIRVWERKSRINKNREWIESWASLRKEILLLKHIVKASIIQSEGFNNSIIQLFRAHQEGAPEALGVKCL